MDFIAGAIELRRRLSRVSGVDLDAPWVANKDVPADAAPLFHWVAIPPPEPEKTGE